MYGGGGSLGLGPVVVVLLVLSTFEDIAYLVYFLRWVVYRSSIFTLVTVSRFFTGTRETANTHHFLFISTFPCFSVFPLLLPNTLLKYIAS